MNLPAFAAPRIARILEGANLIISAWHNNRPAGICRALTDYSYCCYLSDLAVDAAYQRKGIGKHFISLVQQAIGEEASLILLAAPDAMDYYPHIGMPKAENAFVIKRNR